MCVLGCGVGVLGLVGGETVFLRSEGGGVEGFSVDFAEGMAEGMAV